MPFLNLKIMKLFTKITKIVCVGFIAFCGAMVIIDMIIYGSSM
jgi:hypothetical protein